MNCRNFSLSVEQALLQVQVWSMCQGLFTPCPATSTTALLLSHQPSPKLFHQAAGCRAKEKVAKRTRRNQVPIRARLAGIMCLFSSAQSLEKVRMLSVISKTLLWSGCFSQRASLHWERERGGFAGRTWSYRDLLFLSITKAVWSQSPGVGSVQHNTRPGMNSAAWTRALDHLSLSICSTCVAWEIKHKPTTRLGPLKEEQNAPGHSQQHHHFCRIAELSCSFRLSSLTP